MPHSHAKVNWLCPQGHEWQAYVYSRSRGHGCPVCRSSKGETAIASALDPLEVEYERQFSFKACKLHRPLPFDFLALSEGRYGLIEYHGRQHYQPVDFAGRGYRWAYNRYRRQVRRDKRKLDYAQAHGIPLLVVPYTARGKIPEIVAEWVQKLIAN